LFTNSRQRLEAVDTCPAIGKISLRVPLQIFNSVHIPAGTAGEVFTTPAILFTTAGRCFTIVKRVLEIDKTDPGIGKGFLPIPGT